MTMPANNKQIHWAGNQIKSVIKSTPIPLHYKTNLFLTEKCLSKTAH